MMDKYPSLRAQASQTISYLADTLDSALESDDVDIDTDPESLTLEFPCNSQILLTYHGVANQLWLSCPQSGAHHFAFVDNQWVCTRSDQPLTTVLAQDISHYIKRPFGL